jgi:cytochrome c
MARRIPASAVMTAGLLGLAAIASVASLVVQKHQTQVRAESRAAVLTGGDPTIGRKLFDARGCGACHVVFDDRRATGLVGPPLGKIATRAFLAGRQPNDPAHLIAWVQHPQAVEPGVGMPDVGLSDSEARNIAAYLYTLR